MLQGIAFKRIKLLTYTSIRPNNYHNLSISKDFGGDTNYSLLSNQNL